MGFKLQSTNNSIFIQKIPTSIKKPLKRTNIISPSSVFSECPPKALAGTLTFIVVAKRSSSEKHKRKRLSEEEEQFMDCSFLERLFSTCKYVLTDQRKCMFPILFKALIFLKVNRDFWHLPMVAFEMKTNKIPQGAERDSDYFYQE